jgi:hypothetical protein
MRIDLETIKKIEYYLTNNMSDVEKKLFENDMTGSPDLRQAVLEQKNLIMAMEKSTIKDLAINAGMKYRRNLMIKYIAGIGTAIILLVGGYFIYDHSTDSSLVKKKVIVENNVSPNESSPIVSNITQRPVKDSTTFKGFYNPTIENLSANVTDDVLIADSVSKHTIAKLDTLKSNSNIKTDHVVAQVDSIKKEKKPIIDNSKIFHHFVKESEFFTVPVNKDIRIKGIEGTKILIPGGSLVDLEGMPVTGNVTVQLIECYKKSDFIFGDLPTQSNGQLLESGGMIYVDVTQNDQKLKLKSNKKIQIEFAGKTKNDSMLLFQADYSFEKTDWKQDHYYTTKLDTLFTTWKGSEAVISKKSKRKHHVNKKMMNDTVVASRINKTNPAFDNLILESGQLGWIACDRFVENKNNTSLTVKHSLGFIPVIRLVFPSINSMMASQKDGDDATVFQNIPVGVEVDVVVFAMVNDEPYYFTKRITVTNNDIVIIELQKTTMDDLQKFIRKFDNPGKSNDFRLMN